MKSFHLITFGCQMNQHDSENMQELLVAAGYTEVAEPAQADVVLLNTCSVREKAEHKLRSEVGRLGLLKRARPELVIGVAGCVAQQGGEQLLKELPQIDLVLGPDNIVELPELLRHVELGGPAVVRTAFDLDRPRFLSARTRAGARKPTAYVTIMKGCDERCSFCVVPHTRGPERYRPASEIGDEIALLLAQGVREVTLLGQTVNSYRDPARSLPSAPGTGDYRWRRSKLGRAIEDESEFAALLRWVSKRTASLARLRYTSPHPRHLTPALIRAHAELPVLCRHVHLPVQSGSDRVLKRMIRHYTVAEYEERVAALRSAVPGITLSSDVIVGFPGESRADFEQTLALVERVGFTGLFGFKYSPRPHTAALRLGDDVAEHEKSARLAELFALSEAQRRAHLQSLVGTEQSVLIEGPSAQGGGYTGRTERNEIAHVLCCGGDPTGEILDVRITRAFKNSVAAEPLDERRRRGALARSEWREPRQLPVLQPTARNF